jgi:hypothetical protein
MCWCWCWATQSNMHTNQFLVKETDTCIVVSQFNLDRTVPWRGEQFGTVTGTWLHYLSTPMICPCACAAMQQIGMDSDMIDNVHPIYHIWHHSLWKEVIKALQWLLYYCKDSLFYSLPHLEPTSNVPVQDTLSNITMEDRMQHLILKYLTKLEARHMNKMWESTCIILKR